MVAWSQWLPGLSDDEDQQPQQDDSPVNRALGALGLDTSASAPSYLDQGLNQARSGLSSASDAITRTIEPISRASQPQTLQVDDSSQNLSPDSAALHTSGVGDQPTGLAATINRSLGPVERTLGSLGQQASDLGSGLVQGAQSYGQGVLDRIPQAAQHAIAPYEQTGAAVTGQPGRDVLDTISREGIGTPLARGLENTLVRGPLGMTPRPDRGGPELAMDKALLETAGSMGRNVQQIGTGTAGGIVLGGLGLAGDLDPRVTIARDVNEQLPKVDIPGLGETGVGDIIMDASMARDAIHLGYGALKVGAKVGPAILAAIRNRVPAEQFSEFAQGAGREMAGALPDEIPNPTRATEHLLEQASAAGEPYTSPFVQNLMRTYGELSPERAQRIANSAIQIAGDSVQSAIPKKGGGLTDNPHELMGAVHDAVLRKLEDSKTVMTGMTPGALGAYLRGEGLTSKADTRDLDLINKITQGQVNVAGGRVAIVDGKKVKIPYTLEQAADFAQRESEQNRAFAGGTRFPDPVTGLIDEGAPRVMYGYVGEGQPLVGPNQPNLWLAHEEDAPRVTGVNHPFGALSKLAMHGNMAPGNRELEYAEGAIRGGTPVNVSLGPEGKLIPHPDGEPLIQGWEPHGIDVGDGRVIANTDLMVGPSGESSHRASALVSGMSQDVARAIAKGQMTDPEQIASVLMRGGSPKWGGGWAAIQNPVRTEALMLDPSLGRVKAIYMHGPPELLNEPYNGLKGHPSNLDIAHQMRNEIADKYGKDVPILYTNTAERAAEGTGRQVATNINDAQVLAGNPLELSPGRRDIVNQYTQAINPKTKQPYRDIGALPGAGGPGLATSAAMAAAPLRAAIGAVPGAGAGAYAGYQSSPDDASPAETAARTIGGGVAGGLAGGAVAAAGTLAAGHLIDSLASRGAIDPSLLATHPQAADRVRALMSIAAERLPDEATVPVPPMVSAMLQMRPQIAQAVPELTSGAVTAGQVRRLVGDAGSPGVARTVSEMAVDALTGLGGRARRGREMAADAATMGGLSDEARAALPGRAPAGVAALDTSGGPATRVDEQTSPNLVGFVNDIADRLGVPRPGVYVSGSPAVNASASTADGGAPAVILTRGLLNLRLTDDEMAAVLTHELTHTSQDTRNPVQRAVGAVRDTFGASGERDTQNALAEAPPGEPVATGAEGAPLEEPAAALPPLRRPPAISAEERAALAPGERGAVASSYADQLEAAGKPQSSIEKERLLAGVDVASPEELAQRIASEPLAPTTEEARAMLGDRPEYLEPVIKFLFDQRQKLLNGQMTTRDVAKAYGQTLMSVQAQAADKQGLMAKLANGFTKNDGTVVPPNPQLAGLDDLVNPHTGERLGSIFTEAHKTDPNKQIVRPESLGSAWFWTDTGQRALNEITAGRFDPEAWDGLRQARDAFGSNTITNSGALRELTPAEKAAGMVNMTNLPEFTKQMNDGIQALKAAGRESEVGPFLTEQMQRLNGIGTAKNPFIKQLLGMGDSVTIDAREINYWLGGHGLIPRNDQSTGAKLARATSGWWMDRRVREATQPKIQAAVDDLVARYPELTAGVDPSDVGEFMHHWIWDRAGGSQTRHEDLDITQRLAAGMSPVPGTKIASTLANAAGGAFVGAGSESLQANQEGREADPKVQAERALLGAGLGIAAGRGASRLPGRLGAGLVPENSAGLIGLAPAERDAVMKAIRMAAARSGGTAEEIAAKGRDIAQQFGLPGLIAETEKLNPLDVGPGMPGAAPRGPEAGIAAPLADELRRSGQLPMEGIPSDPLQRGPGMPGAAPAGPDAEAAQPVMDALRRSGQLPMEGLPEDALQTGLSGIAPDSAAAGASGALPNLADATQAARERAIKMAEARGTPLADAVDAASPASPSAESQLQIPGLPPVDPTLQTGRPDVSAPASIGSQTMEEALPGLIRSLSEHRRPPVTDPSLQDALPLPKPDPTNRLQEALKAVGDTVPQGLGDISLSGAAQGVAQRAGVVRYGGMLSSTAGRATDAVASLLGQLNDVGTGALATPIDIARVGILKAMGVKNAERVSYAGETPARLAGMHAGLRQGWGDMMDVIKTGLSPGEQAKLESSGFNAAGIPGLSHLPESVTNKIDLAMELPLRAMAASDALFRSTAMGGHLMAEAYAAARKANKGVEPTTEMVRQAANDPALLARVQDLGKRSVLQEDRGVTAAYQKFVDGLDPVSRAALKTAAPFVRTPYNILAQGAEMSPFGVATAINDLRNGRNREAVTKISRSMLGTGVMGMAGVDYASGNLTGPYPSDSKEASTLPPGWKPWSQKITTPDGQTYYIPLANLGPLAMPAVAAIIGGEAWKHGTDPADIAGKIAGGVGQYAGQQSFLQGLDSLYQATQNPERFGQNAAEQIAASYSPYIVGGGALGRDIQRAMGMPSRDPHGMLEALLATTPYTAGMVAPKQDVLGRPASMGIGGPAAFAVRGGEENDASVIRAFRRANLGLPMGAPKSLTDPSTKAPRALSDTQQERWRRVFGSELRSSYGNAGGSNDPEDLKRMAAEARQAADDAILGAA